MYDITLTIADKIIEIDTKYISFMIQSSIWGIVNKGLLVINDSSGIYQEYLLTVPGTPVKITYQYEDTRIIGDFIVDGDLIDDVATSNQIGGNIQLPLVHRWTSEQELISKAFDSNISNVIEQVAGKYNFESLNIDATENKNIWYQPLMTDIDFIQDVLMPRALSKNEKTSPMFCYVDEYNNFNLKNYQSLFKTNPIQDLDYTQKTRSDFDFSVLQDISRKRPDYKNTFPLHKILASTIDINNGELLTIEDPISAYPSPTGTQKLPIVKKDGITSEDFYWKGYDINSILGKRIYAQRKSISQDKFILISYFNPKIKAGSTINLKTYTIGSGDESAESLSQYAGKYLVEETSHIWDGFAGSAITKMIVSRKYTKLTNNYVLRDNLT